MSKVWQGLAYTYSCFPIKTPQGQGIVIIGVAGAIRDDKQFTTGIVLPLISPEDYDWKKDAKARLDTYLECECNSFSKCLFHFSAEPEWHKNDQMTNKITMEMIPDGIRGILGPPRDQDAPRIIRPH
jgi:hypothetical protein